MTNRSGHPFEYSDVEALAANRTLTRKDSGKLFLVGAVDLVASLPDVTADANLKGVSYDFFIDAASAVTGFSVSPGATDKIRGKGITAADNKDIINTAATDAVGDYISVACDGTDWVITSMLGTWAREA